MLVPWRGKNQTFYLQLILFFFRFLKHISRILKCDTFKMYFKASGSWLSGTIYPGLAFKFSVCVAVKTGISKSFHFTVPMATSLVPPSALLSSGLESTGVTQKSGKTCEVLVESCVPKF